MLKMNKTLKDMGNQCNCGVCGECVLKKELKAIVIKWGKEDLKWINGCVNDLVQQELLIYMYEWMKRLDIIEEDLK